MLPDEFYDFLADVEHYVEHLPGNYDFIERCLIDAFLRDLRGFAGNFPEIVSDGQPRSDLALTFEVSLIPVGKATGKLRTRIDARVIRSPTTRPVNRRESE